MSELGGGLASRDWSNVITEIVSSNPATRYILLH